MDEKFLKIVSWVKRGKQRIFVLKNLNKFEPIFPNELKKKINLLERENNVSLSLSEVSRNLLAFKKLNLVKCIDEELPWGRTYIMTDFGKKILKNIN